MYLGLIIVTALIAFRHRTNQFSSPHSSFLITALIDFLHRTHQFSSPHSSFFITALMKSRHRTPDFQSPHSLISITALRKSNLCTNNASSSQILCRYTTFFIRAGDADGFYLLRNVHDDMGFIGLILFQNYLGLAQGYCIIIPNRFVLVWPFDNLARQQTLPCNPTLVFAQCLDTSEGRGFYMRQCYDIVSYSFCQYITLNFRISQPLKTHSSLF